MIRKLLVVAIVALFLCFIVVPAIAQDDAGNVIAEGLNNPRGIAYDADGNLYIAESGAGGERIVFEAEGVQLTGELTGAVTKIAPDGSQSSLLSNIPSVLNPNEGAFGVYRAIPHEDSLWLVFTDDQGLTLFSDSVVELDMATLTIKNYIDLFPFEIANNSDGTEEVYSNPSDVAFAPDGTIYILDTGANTLYTWSEADGLAVAHAWTDDPVPTAIEFAPDGSFYVSFLGQGFLPGAGHIEHWSADGSELLDTVSDLTTITDILVTEAGDLYAVQIVVLGEQGPVPESGAVLKITDGEVTPVMEGLSSPFGLAMTPEGNLLVSTDSAFAVPGTGAVIEIPLGE